ncbi:hypothetical protein DB29_04216 [Shouchella clausii]|nr:hypothetical protein DB29_04216 [Shouchella clausii]
MQYVSGSTGRVVPVEWASGADKKENAQEAKTKEKGVKFSIYSRC